MHSALPLFINSLFIFYVVPSHILDCGQVFLGKIPAENALADYVFKFYNYSLNHSLLSRKPPFSDHLNVNVLSFHFVAKPDHLNVNI